MRTKNRVDFKFDMLNQIEYTDLSEYVINYTWSNDTVACNVASGDKIAWNDSYVLPFYSSNDFLLIQPWLKNIKLIDNKLEYLASALTNAIIDKIDNVVILKSMLVTLKPLGKQKPHIDSMWYHDLCHRLVIPITTNDKCVTYFIENKTTIEEKLSIGHVYEMNNKISHFSVNFGECHRVSMFIDLIPLQNLQNFKEHISKLTKS